MCHDDNDFGECYIEDTELNGKVYSVCCDVLRWLEANNNRQPEPAEESK